MIHWLAFGALRRCYVFEHLRNSNGQFGQLVSITQETTLPLLVKICSFILLMSKLDGQVHQITCRAAMNSVEWNPKHNLLGMIRTSTGLMKVCFAYLALRVHKASKGHSLSPKKSLKRVTLCII